MKRSRTGVAVAIGFAALVLGACGPAGVQDAGHGSATTSAVATTTEASPSATTEAPTPASSPTTTAAPSPTAAPPTTAPAVHATTRPPVHRTTPPPVHHTSAPPKPALCSIRSNAGNCYKAGQYCRKADLGRTTTDADGRAITCKIVSGQPHWHY
ncbi:hypothetical protein [Actinacidiphila bryophytorum]|uniref:hypothetical protein n=1 Tax=Actinacidiphila bryophytorum TaxID=1436133 RepID=UPI0019616255|nr:hypothetical protein [Actinacidiphila bryophytorum]MBM9435233.1 hypothetical protein [Actinacidiphila bryophytorum]MBN6546848.1 hypothetical protein [Actinacidiphila bryophytorum]